MPQLQKKEHVLYNCECCPQTRHLGNLGHAVLFRSFSKKKRTLIMHPFWEGPGQASCASVGPLGGGGLGVAGGIRQPASIFIARRESTDHLKSWKSKILSRNPKSKEISVFSAGFENLAPAAQVCSLGGPQGLPTANGNRGESRRVEGGGHQGNRGRLTRAVRIEVGVEGSRGESRRVEESRGAPSQPPSGLIGQARLGFHLNFSEFAALRGVLSEKTQFFKKCAWMCLAWASVPAKQPNRLQSSQKEHLNTHTSGLKPSLMSLSPTSDSPSPPLPSRPSHISTRAR